MDENEVDTFDLNTTASHYKDQDCGTSCGYEGWQTFVRRVHPRLVVSNFLAKKADGSKKDQNTEILL